METETKRWTGTPPTACDVCEEPITIVFVDGKTRMGPWGILCPVCHHSVGVGLGKGRGQGYELVEGDWLKTCG